MMEAKDWVSFFTGLVIAAFGIIPLLGMRGIGPAWFKLSLSLSLLGYIAAIGGFYLIINSIVEITNSNVMGWVSIAFAAIVTLVGILHVLGQFGKITGFFALAWIPPFVFFVIFIALGLFLMIAAFAMEL